MSPNKPECVVSTIPTGTFSAGRYTTRHFQQHTEDALIRCNRCSSL